MTTENAAANVASVTLSTANLVSVTFDIAELLVLRGRLAAWLEEAGDPLNGAVARRLLHSVDAAARGRISTFDQATK